MVEAKLVIYSGSNVRLDLHKVLGRGVSVEEHDSKNRLNAIIASLAQAPMFNVADDGVSFQKGCAHLGKSGKLKSWYVPKCWVDS